MVRHSLIGILLFAIALLALWYATDVEQPTADGAAEQAASPDYRMRDFNVTVYDKQGRVNYRVQAENMDYFTHSDVTLLQTPRIEIIQEGDNRWFVDARQGKLTDQAKNVYLQGEVLITQNVKGDTTPTRIETNDILLHTENKTVETQRAVHIHHALGTVDAIGLKANLNTNRVELLSEVKSRYRPKGAMP